MPEHSVADFGRRASSAVAVLFDMLFPAPIRAGFDGVFRSVGLANRLREAMRSINGY